MTERFIVDDAGTLIDMQTRDMFDIVEEVCPLLNEQHEEIGRLKQKMEKVYNSLIEENEQLKEALKELKEIGDYQSDRIQELNDENEQLKKDLIDHSALISMLEDYQALKIEETLYNLTGAKSEEEFNELYKPYLEKAKRCWR